MPPPRLSQRGLHQCCRIQPLLRGQPPPPFRALLRGNLGGFGIAGSQRRIFARLRRVLQPARLDVRIDLGRADGECFHHRTRHAGDLESAVAAVVPGDGGEAERLDPAAQRGQEHRIHDMLALVQLVRVQRPPLAVGGAGRIGDDVVNVELRLAAAVHVVEEGRGHEAAGRLGHLSPTVPDPRFRDVALRPG